MMNDEMNRELGWEEEIENEGSENVLLPEGDYPFTVTKFERGRSKGSEKLPPCNMAILTIRLDDQTTVTENLLLNKKLEWKLCQFFVAIGARKHGEKFRMNWSKVTGASGYCKVIIEEYTNKDGKIRQINRIDKFLDPENAPQGQTYAAPQTPTCAAAAAPQQAASYAPPAQHSAFQQRKWTPGAGF